MRLLVLGLLRGVAFDNVFILDFVALVWIRSCLVCVWQVLWLFGLICLCFECDWLGFLYSLLFTLGFLCFDWYFSLLVWLLLLRLGYEFGRGLYLDLGWVFGRLFGGCGWIC